MDLAKTCHAQLAELQAAAAHQVNAATAECGSRVSQAETKCANAAVVTEQYKTAYDTIRRSQEQVSRDCAALQARAIDAEAQVLVSQNNSSSGLSASPQQFQKDLIAKYNETLNNFGQQCNAQVTAANQSTATAQRELEATIRQHAENRRLMAAAHQQVTDELKRGAQAEVQTRAAIMGAEAARDSDARQAVHERNEMRK